MTESFSKTLVSTQAHLIQLEKQLTVDEHKTKCLENFSLPEFLLKYENAVTEISQLGAQMEFAYLSSSLTNVKELQDLFNNIKTASDNLVFIFHSLPIELGWHFHLDILMLTEGILSALVHLIHSLKIKESKIAKMPKTPKMPKNNLESVLRFLHKEKLQLLDALQNIDEEVKSNFSALKYGVEIDNTEVWNNQDRKLLPPCVALVKTSLSCLKKIISAIKSRGNCSTTTNIHQLDEIAFRVEDLTQAVDNFVAAFYPPLNKKDVKQDAFKVVSAIQNLLIQVQSSHFMDEEDQNWLNVLSKSVDHNNNKLQPLFSDEHFYEISETDNSDED